MAQNPANVIKSYLIGLGFEVDAPGQREWENTIGKARSTVGSATAGIGLDMVKWQGEILGLFATVTGAIVGTVDKVAMADQEYRLFGERMFMNTRQAREYKTALDALGQPIEAVAWDPELHERFKELIADQKRMEGMLGPNFEAQMKQIRDVRFEFTRTGVELQNLAMIFVSTLFTKLGGSGDVLADLRKANEWLLEHLPELANELSDEAIPILKDTWGMLKDLGEMLKYAGVEFTNLVGIISGDDSLTKEQISFHDFARAVEDVVHWLAEFVQIMFQVEKVGGAGVDFLVTGLHSLGLGLTQKQIDKDVDRQSADINKGWEGIKGIFHILGGGGSYDGGHAPAFMAGPARGVADAAARAKDTERNAVGLGAGADLYRGLAQRVSAATGIDADLIFAQWAHETGKFTNRGTRDLHNLGGVRIPGTTTYQNFASWDEYVAADAKLLTSRRYAGLKDVHSADAYAAILKHGGYFEGPLDAYQKQMRSFQGAYRGGGGGNTTSVTIENLHIMQPNATAEQIGASVADKVHAKAGMQTQRNLVEANGVFG